ncbi:hypothetical protein [Arenibacter algicola]|nr:hypothetical protein [Arenibacter algicola]
MDKSKASVYQFPSSNDYRITENQLLGSLFTIPSVFFFEGWLFNYFLTQSAPSIMGISDRFGNPPFYKRKIVDEVYTLTKEEISFVNNDKLAKEIDYLFERFHLELRKSHLFFVNKNDFDLVHTYARCIYYLKGSLEVSPYKEGRIIAPSLDWNSLLMRVKRSTTELIAELDWRISRLNPNNYLVCNLTDEELKTFFDAILANTFRLYDSKSFVANFDKISQKLIPNYFHKDTTAEDLFKLFKGGLQIFANPLIWVGATNSLSYFLRQLNAKEKLLKHTYFQTAEKLLSNNNGELFSGLKNNKSVPANAIEIDAIVDLF